MAIFLDELDYSRFLDLYASTIERFELDAWLLTPMPNHYHLVFRTRKPNLSRAIHYLNGRFAQWWNRRHGHVGHVLQARFKAQVVEDGIYLLRLCRYILLNPVRAKLVSHPVEWSWNNYDALRKGTDTRIAHVESLLRALDPDASPQTRERLLDFVGPEHDGDIADFVRRDVRVIGSERFASQFALDASTASRQAPARERRIGTPPLVNILSDAVRRGDGLHGGVRDARAALYSIEDIARCAGLAPRTVANLVNRGSHRGVARQSLNTDLTPNSLICRPDP